MTAEERNRTQKEGPVYLDYAATTPVDPRVLEEMLPYFTEHYGNPASHHTHGEHAKRAVDVAKEQIASLVNTEAEEVIFTSGATEAINLAIKGLYLANYERRSRIITVKTEHKAVLDTCGYLEELGADVVYLDVDEEGILDWQQYEDELNENTLLVCVMYANNETGVLQDVKHIAQRAKEAGAYFMTDATQAFGKIPVDVLTESVDILTFSGHKIYGPKGIGGLCLRKDIPLVPLLHGGGHQQGLRSGTLNVPLIVGMGKAAEIAKLEMADEAIRLTSLRDKFEEKLLSAGKIKVNGKRDQRLPNISNIQLLEWDDAEDFIQKYTDQISVSTGSACNAEILEPSHVLQAMLGSLRLTKKSVRISYISTSNIDFVAELFH